MTTTFNPVAPVDCRRGAPMGRESGWRESVAENDPKPTRVNLSKVRINSGGYDSGGAYWGHGEQLWCASSPNGDWTSYFRAGTRERAKASVLAEMPGAKFFR